MHTLNFSWGLANYCCKCPVNTYFGLYGPHIFPTTQSSFFLHLPKKVGICSLQSLTEAECRTYLSMAHTLSVPVEQILSNKIAVKVLYFCQHVECEIASHCHYDVMKLNIIANVYWPLGFPLLYNDYKFITFLHFSSGLLFLMSCILVPPELYVLYISSQFLAFLLNRNLI